MTRRRIADFAFSNTSHIRRLLWPNEDLALVELRQVQQPRLTARQKVIYVLVLKVWGCDIIVDWADPQEEPDEQTMSKVKVLYVRNLTQDVTEEKLKVRIEIFYIDKLY